MSFQQSQLDTILATINPTLELNDGGNPFHLLCAVIMSAQTTDVQVNKITPALFVRYPTVDDFANADENEMMKIIGSIPFFRNKSKNMIGAAKLLISSYARIIPDTIEELIKLPGVGRKTANVMLINLHNKPGVVVDTHVKRVANRLKWTTNTDPTKIEADLAKVIPEAQQVAAGNALVLFGRRICQAKKPQCKMCPILDSCPYLSKVLT